MTTIYFTSAVRQRTGVGETELQYEGDIDGLLSVLGQTYGEAFVSAIYAQENAEAAGTINGAVNIYVDGTDIRYLQQLQTPVGLSSTVDLVPAVSGG